MRKGNITGLNPRIGKAWSSKNQQGRVFLRCQGEFNKKEKSRWGHGGSVKKITALDLILASIAGLFLLFLYFRITQGLHYRWNWSVIPQFFLYRAGETGRWVPNLLIRGLFTTLKLSLWSSGIALFVGSLIGIMGTSKRLLFRLISRFYVEVIRNIPPLVIIFIFYYFIGSQILDSLGLDLAVRNLSPGMKRLLTLLSVPPERFSAFVSAVITLGIYEGSYIAEIVRGGIQSLDRGQWEASYSLGLSRFQQLRFIILPQAFRRILPALAGQFISAIKDSSIVSVISIQELTFQGMEIMASTYRTFEIWITIMLLYFLLTFLFSLFLHRIIPEKSFGA